jgi:hypothetical protein
MKRFRSERSAAGEDVLSQLARAAERKLTAGDGIEPA